jgi:YD repeat-containing protein
MDEAGRITQLEDGAGGIWEREYDSNGQLSVVTDPTGRTLTYTYNSSGLLHQVVDDEGNTWSTYWTWSSGSPMLVAYSLPDGSEYYLSLNSDGSIATVYEASLTTSGSSLTGASLTSALDSFTWDSAGGLDTWTQGSLTLDIDRDSDGLVTAVTDLWGVQRDYTYDAYGRLSTLTTPQGVALTYGWDSAHPTQMSTVTLGSTTQLTMTYDALGRLEDVEDALGSVTTFGYDSATGTLDEVATGDGAVWSYTRNGGGYLTGVDGSSGFSMTYSYDAAGRMNGTDVTVSLP